MERIYHITGFGDIDLDSIIAISEYHYGFGFVLYFKSQVFVVGVGGNIPTNKINGEPVQITIHTNNYFMFEATKEEYEELNNLKDYEYNNYLTKKNHDKVYLPLLKAWKNIKENKL